MDDICEGMVKLRLAKYLSQAGVASRRHAEELISAGRIKLNGSIVTEVATFINPDKDRISCDDLPVSVPLSVYIMLNKPAGYLSTVHDPQGRPTVIELVSDLDIRVHPVGRLDYDTEGLLLLTNDGEFTNLIIHPRYKIEKRYVTEVKGYLTDKAQRDLCLGIELEDGITAPAAVRVIERNSAHTILEISIHEGRKRQVKRMCAAVGNPVIRLTRTGLGFLNLEGLPKGHYRFLGPEEVSKLKSLATD